MYDTGGLSIKGKVYPTLACAAQHEKYVFFSVSVNLLRLSISTEWGVCLVHHIIREAEVDHLKPLFLLDHSDHNARDEEGLWWSCCHSGSFQSNCQTGQLRSFLCPDAFLFYIWFNSLLFLCQGFKDNLHAVFCLAENAVGPIATRPDDIHTLYSGK